ARAAGRLGAPRAVKACYRPRALARRAARTMSKKDKDKRKKSERPPSAWAADLRPSRDKAAQPAPWSGFGTDPASSHDVEPEPLSPPTRRSSPFPQAGLQASPSPDEGGDGLDRPIPRLRPVRIESPVPDAPGEEEGADVAPVGPTEYAGSFAQLSPESQAAPTLAARPAASMEQLEQQIRDLEARLDEMIKHPASAAPGAPAQDPRKPPPPIPSEPGLSTASPTIPAGAG